VDAPEDYTVSRDSLNQLIIAYFSTPMDHSQLVQLSYTNIESQDTDGNPTVDPTHRQFKNNIRLSDCRFDSNKATPDAISKWLGPQTMIKILEEEEETSSVLFQIDHKDSHGVLGHKRKHCEVAEENDDQINYC
jgi:hypothetical protein